MISRLVGGRIKWLEEDRDSLGPSREMIAREKLRGVTGRRWETAVVGLEDEAVSSQVLK